mmetsp:Transcript_33395/g.67398  ORF Transcript_33395/g.67398 Transcript_33395/m.67398 type:complete len:85 (-) Transcript_33395:1212-1466(-)
MYTTNDVPNTASSNTDRRGSDIGGVSVRDALRYVYTDLWVESVVKSPLYRPGEMSEAAAKSFDIASTQFEKRLDAYLQSMPWFR